MPLTIPTTTATKANFADPLKSFVDGLETGVATAQSRADSAHSLAATKYTKPSTGIAEPDLSAAVVTKLNGDVPGSLNNPITDPNAARPAGLTCVVWDTPTAPVHRAVGDFNLQAP